MTDPKYIAAAESLLDVPAWHGKPSAVERLAAALQRLVEVSRDGEPCALCQAADYGCPHHACEVCGKSSASRPHSPGCPLGGGDLAGLAAHDR